MQQARIKFRERGYLAHGKHTIEPGPWKYSKWGANLDNYKAKVKCERATMGSIYEFELETREEVSA
jgi:hypothetical protein